MFTNVAYFSIDFTHSLKVFGLPLNFKTVLEMPCAVKACETLVHSLFMLRSELELELELEPVLGHPF